MCDNARMILTTFAAIYIAVTAYVVLLKLERLSVGARLVTFVFALVCPIALLGAIGSLIFKR